MYKLQRHVFSLTFVLLIAALITGLLVVSPAQAKMRAPKNIIIMISDGWGYNAITSTSYYNYGKYNRQVYNMFPLRSGMSTYEAYLPDHSCYNKGYDPAMAWSDFNYVKSCYTDSASAATAMSTGIKTLNGNIGVATDDVTPLYHLMQLAEEKGKMTGVVTSVEFSHATPAGFVAHNANRNNYSDIANEMILDSATDVIMGTGHPFYNNDGVEATRSDPYRYVGGQVTWDALVAGTAGGDADGDGIADPWTLIETRAEFQTLMSGDTPQRLVGVPQVYSTLQQSRSGDGYADPFVVPLIETVPTLVEMTLGALNVLDNDPDGYVLMIEGGAVDWAGHANQSGRIIEEQTDFDNTVQAVVDWVHQNSNWGETLLIVTGDHETGYLTGPGSDPTWNKIVNKGQGVLPGMEWHSGDHINTLIPFFAKGAAAHLFQQYLTLKDPVRGLYIDNTNIAHVIFALLESQ